MIWLITAATSRHQELKIISSAFDAGLQTLLLRKSGWPEHTYASWLEQLPARYRPKVMVSTYPSLVETFGLKGVHLSEEARARTAPYEIKKLRASGKWVSTSVHTESEDTSAFDFVLLGPMFDSISKPGHLAARFTSIPPNAIAVGGVQTDRIAEIHQRGCCGAAALGTVWEHPERAADTIASLINIWNQCASETTSIHSQNPTPPCHTP